MVLEEQLVVMVGVGMRLHFEVFWLVNLLSNPVRWVLTGFPRKATKVYRVQAQRKGHSQSYIPG